MTPTILLSTVSSDAHTWNLVYLELLLRERGHRVRNLGACVPDDLLLRTCLLKRPGLLMLSSVNGHGADDGERLIRRLREVPALTTLPAVIGGKLGTSGDTGAADRRHRLIRAGFDEVFEGADSIPRFLGYLDRLQHATGRSLVHSGQKGGR
ncbi:cobalamin B12-binding domain-containing protein [Amycolatopsis sp. GM8]|uniref:cobalamin B12-binding domain-containing protein n=1 Tax=Amycolatopsis sp. GM8 TaxID=2896530 RepID=UPI001EEDC617|nr:cobalamin-dependent protein [Amycolatopsis sp. GM8]